MSGRFLTHFQVFEKDKSNKQQIKCLNLNSKAESCKNLENYTVLRPRIICLKYVHPGKRARAQKLYIFSSYTYAFDETFTCVWIILWCISLEWQEAHLDDGFTQTIPPRLLPDIQMIDMFFKPASHWSASRALIGRYADAISLTYNS